MHHNLITFAQGKLNPQLPSDLRVRVEERVFVESLEGPGRSMYPDIRVVERADRTALDHLAAHLRGLRGE